MSNKKQNLTDFQAIQDDSSVMSDIENNHQIHLRGPIEPNFKNVRTMNNLKTSAIPIVTQLKIFERHQPTKADIFAVVASFRCLKETKRENPSTIAVQRDLTPYITDLATEHTDSPDHMKHICQHDRI